MLKKDQIKKLNAGLGPVFIVGMNGSGTTMLVDSLGNHPDLYVFPQESLVLPYFISRISSFGDLSKSSGRRKLADALGKSWAFWFVNNRKKVILKDSELNQPGFSGVVDSMFKHFAASQGKLRWGEKSPMYLQHIGILATYFPNAKFIHIYRDGRDVAQSIHRRYMKDPRWTIYRWKKILKMGRDQGQKIGSSRYMEVRYETLTADPKNQLHQVCKFLDLQYHPFLFKASYRHIDRDQKIENIVPNSNKWRKYFNENQILKLELIAGDYLKEMGYSISTVPASIVNPTGSQLFWWEFNDRFKSTWNLFKKRGGIYSAIKYFPRFSRKALHAIRQKYTNKY
jgi:hypothetical protein